MTVCIYLSPKSIICPIIITDTITSDQNGKVIGEIATRSMNNVHNYYIDQLSLVRKNLLIGDRTAIAFSGNISSIQDFLEYAELSIGDIDDDRPLKDLGQRASEYGYSRVNVISALVVPENNILHFVRPEYAIELENDYLGYYTAIGSGAKEAMRRVEEFIEVVREDGDNDFSIAQLVASAICVDGLWREIYESSQGDDQEDTWGGIFEYIFFHPIEKCWKRQPKTVYFFYQIYFDDPNPSANLIDRMFLYEPGQENGWLHVIRSSQDHSYNLTYRLSPIHPPSNDIKTFIWDDWIPENVVLCLTACEKHGDGVKIGSKFFGAYEVDDYNGVTSQIGRTGIRLLPFGDKLESFLVEGAKNLMPSI